MSSEAQVNRTDTALTRYRFLLIAKIFAVFFICVPPLVRNFFNPQGVDFQQFYMGGVIARHGAWDAMYPVPHEGILNNPGDPQDSDMRPRYAELAVKYEVGDEDRFIQPPPASVVFIPFAFLKYTTAEWVWMFLMLGCQVIVVFQAIEFFRMLIGRETFFEGWLLLFLAAAPSLRRGITPGNISPLAALMLSSSILFLIRQKPVGSAASIVIGGMLKYATGVYMPLLVAMRRWKEIVYSAIFGFGWIGLSLWVMGVEPFRQYAKIFPLLNLPWLIRDQYNQCLYSLIYRYVKINPLPDFWLRAVSISRWLILIGLLIAIFRVRRDDWKKPQMVIAAASSLVAWLLIFGPIFWMHYLVYFFWMLGWVAWEALQPSWPRRILAIVAIFFAWGPWFVETKIDWLRLSHQPMEFHGLYAATAILVLGAWRLCLRDSVSATNDLQSA